MAAASSPGHLGTPPSNRMAAGEVAGEMGSGSVEGVAVRRELQSTALQGATALHFSYLSTLWRELQ
eukprot:2498711-Prorocentrum_lima.AAC.1